MTRHLQSLLFQLQVYLSLSFLFGFCVTSGFMPSNSNEFFIWSAIALSETHLSRNVYNAILDCFEMAFRRALPVFSASFV
jgi:hypothetical protein